MSQISTPRSQAPITLFVHGALCDARFWEPQVAALGEAGLPAEAVHLRGYYPDQFDPKTFTSELHLHDIVGRIACAEGPVHLVGHSRGARLALAAAARFPDRIKSLVLAEPGGAREAGFLSAQDEPPARLPDQLVSKLLDEGDRIGAVRRFIEGALGADAWEHAPRPFREQALDNADALRGIMADKSNPLSRTVASSVRAPVLLIEGARSPKLFHYLNDVLQEVMFNVRRVRLLDGDHFMTYTDRAGFDTSLVRFLSSHS